MFFCVAFLPSLLPCLDWKSVTEPNGHWHRIHYPIKICVFSSPFGILLLYSALSKNRYLHFSSRDLGQTTKTVVDIFNPEMPYFRNSKSRKEQKSSFRVETVWWNIDAVFSCQRIATSQNAVQSPQLTFAKVRCAIPFGFFLVFHSFQRMFCSHFSIDSNYNRNFVVWMAKIRKKLNEKP